MSKGSRNRVKNLKAFEEGYETIFGKDHKAQSTPKDPWKCIRITRKSPLRRFLERKQT